MRFPRYPKYKDSGVQWLGEVPAHWEVRGLTLSLRSRCVKLQLARLLFGFYPSPWRRDA